MLFRIVSWCWNFASDPDTLLMFSRLLSFQVQYEFLHELAMTYINSFENYANFK